MTESRHLHPHVCPKEKAGPDDSDGRGGGRKKRRLMSSKGKLMIGQRVEVRSKDDGSLGSWHSGRVITADHRKRGVEYDHILTEDGSQKLVEFVPISAAVDGFVSNNFYGSNSCKRGFIRPLPPIFVFGPWDLHYGLCVDVFYNDSWWEGVVFDHEDGEEYRKVFFPDLGDELTTPCGSESIHITQDWDEKKDSWRRRGRWVFLEVIEEYEEEWPLVISVKQIWYDLRQKEEFRDLEWTCSDKSLWEKLVAEVMSDNLNIVAAAVLPLLHSYEDSENNHSKNELPLSEKDVAIRLAPSQGGQDLVMKTPEAISGSVINCDIGTVQSPAFSSEPEPSNNPSVAANIESKKVDISHNCCIPVDCGSSIKPLPVTNPHDPGSEEHNMIDVIGISTNLLDGTGNSFALEAAKRLEEDSSLSRSLYNMPNEESYPVNSGCNMNISSQACKSLCVGYESPVPVPVATCMPSFAQSNFKNTGSTEEDSQYWKPCNIHFKAKFNPDAVRDYVWKTSNESPSSRICNVRQHLVSLGWRMYFQRNDVNVRFRYISPEGKCYYSLGLLCRDLLKTAKVLSLPMPEDSSPRFPSSLGGPIVLLHPEKPQRKEQHGFLTADESPPSVHSPEAVIDYYNLNLKGRPDKHTHEIKQNRMNAKKHLAAIGWTFSRMEKRGGRQVAVYVSPDGRMFQSLVKACELCIKGGQLLCPSAGQLVVAENRNLRDAVLTTEHVTSRDPSKANTWGSRSHGNCSSVGESSHQSTTNWTPRSSFARPVEASRPAHVLSSTKRVRKEVSRPNQANPKTLFSWLIDKNIMLPREKLSYRSDANLPSLAVGRASRLGIKCGCCQAVFNLRAFINHAGITHSKPTSKIFLSDGRSLLDCQQQALCGIGSSRFMKESDTSRTQSKRHKAENDYICTVCHYGGKLILCDQCPSSFHMECIGLKEVPDGEWFCPSCCCIICKRRLFVQTTESSTDGDILNCRRCEQNYHTGCLRAKGADHPENSPQGRRYCSAICEKISEDLDVIVEKEIIVGKDKLKWTLLKSPERDIASHDASDMEDELEIRIKLHLALDVMHECFETVKEPFTNSDLVEDVIFNRRSPLHRLNFRGFYTVLLERDDELITVATVRIYGKRVAEVPLVGTRFHYRRLGMCRILMNTLEKTLKELGVERLVLPAVPGVLNTWTTSFGFKQMTESERVQFRSYTFLDFQGTIMCHKELQDVTSKGPSLPEDILHAGRLHSQKVNLEGMQMNLLEDNNSIAKSNNDKDHNDANQGFNNNSIVIQEAATEGVCQDHMRKGT
ncbi:hypothetical protein MLD38_011520 [Melastoma candidum]|uniref:Uncharacterized protein n=1 Tax=Melastoma candidum TaxID=119954 RepID=A0ACB9R2Y0_9MYRT|nr:hypothetical protein MLD38_011520 [Melastoma candidum]